MQLVHNFRGIHLYPGATKFLLSFNPGPVLRLKFSSKSEKALYHYCIVENGAYFDWSQAQTNKGCNFAEHIFQHVTSTWLIGGVH
ncbi:hypothetical protein HYALB_00012196 [Hymenoscyphus albidus]|uniref:Uncharacterized protein n=1 Tax=Hymenoscyphus albidus TaxID=595503 RepID=A0A9N9PU05_9HELO|nr:hypothetical protein HYALB_00012196 [Hymenoscyphus albidus]